MKAKEKKIIKSGMVKIPGKNFKMDVTEVTVAQFEECVKAGGCSKKNFKTNSDNLYNNYGTSNKNHPMNGVNWYGAEEFCQWAGKRLPTEQEWEYAAKGGENYTYAGSDNVDSVAWYYYNSGMKTHQVATKKANGYGLYDMGGNVWEWTNSWYDSSNENRVLRGGSFNNDDDSIRVDYRAYFNPSSIGNYSGFRCVQSHERLEKKLEKLDKKTEVEEELKAKAEKERLKKETEKKQAEEMKKKQVKEELKLKAEEELKAKESKTIKSGMVKIPGKNFKMDVTEVTNKEYEQCVNAGKCVKQHYTDGKCYVYDGGWKQGNVTSEFKEDKKPAVCVDFYQVQTYCKWSGKRLPTEEEWEYAAKGGENFKYAGSNDADEVAWYSVNSGNKTHKVGTKKANGYGLYDMSGNVWEWTNSWYDSSNRVLRGGSFYDGVDYCDSNNPTSISSIRGFRCVQSQDEEGLF